MSLTPQITLNASLVDFSGNQIGSSTQPAYLRIALCGYGQSLPRVAGTAMIGQVVSWPANLLYTGAELSVKLWGNDVITPSGTYYTIDVLDVSKNVIQSGAYQFSGSQTIDLSTVMPYFPTVVVPTTPTVLGGLVIEPYSASPQFNCAMVAAGIITFEMTLSGDVTAAAMQNVSPGQIVVFALIQDGTGGHAFNWPSTVENATIINPAPGSKTVQPFITLADGNLYPMSGGTYN
jgi:hypothetical protein